MSIILTSINYIIVIKIFIIIIVIVIILLLSLSLSLPLSSMQNVFYHHQQKQYWQKWFRYLTLWYWLLGMIITGSVLYISGILSRYSIHQNNAVYRGTKPANKLITWRDCSFSTWCHPFSCNMMCHQIIGNFCRWCVLGSGECCDIRYVYDIFIIHMWFPKCNAGMVSSKYIYNKIKTAYILQTDTILNTFSWKSLLKK